MVRELSGRRELNCDCYVVMIGRRVFARNVDQLAMGVPERLVD